MRKLEKVYFIIVINIINSILKGPRMFYIKRKLLRSIGIYAGNSTKVVGPLYIGTEAKLIIGDRCWIGRDFKVDGNGTVIIGDNCDLAPEVIIATGSHVIGNCKRRAGEGINHKTEIGNSTWIGTRSTIIEGSNVGNSCIVGAASLVNKNIEDNLLVAGVPAKRIRKL